MGRLRAIRLVAALLLVSLASAGCAARWAYRQGQEARDRGDWDLAVARYTKALEKDPDNITFKIALENARVQASRLHYDAGRKAIAANDLEKAAEELEVASNYDPGNRSAAEDLAIVRARMLKRDEEARERASFDERRERAAQRTPVPVLSPRSQVPIKLSYVDASLQKIFESLGKLAGVNVLFDEGFRDKKVSVNLTDITFQEALDRLSFVNRLFYKVLDQNTIIVVPESRQKRIAYDEVVLRTFYLQNAEINDTVNLIKTLAKVTTAAGNPSIGAITVLGTVDQIAIAERIIESNDKTRGEVLVEVQILEVNKNKFKRWGIDISNYTAGLTLNPHGNQDDITAGLLSIRAHLLSSLNRADWIVSIPSTIFARFLATENTTRILAAPRLRAAEGKPAELKIGTEVPIPVTSYTVGVGGGNIGGGYYPATSFQYRNVGVNLKLTPRVSASGDITLEMTAEFSLLGADRNVGSEDNPINVPTFLTRNVNGVLRVRDGETSLIGGLLQGSETGTWSGAIGTNSIPIIGSLFGNREKEKDESEVLISITPRIVRAPKVTDADLVALRVGTQEVPRVEGARPGLFGTDAPAPPAAPAPGAAPAAAPGAPGVAPSTAAPGPPVAVPVPVPVAPGGEPPAPAPGPTAPGPVSPGQTTPGTTTPPAGVTPGTGVPPAATPGTTIPPSATPGTTVPPGTSPDLTPPSVPPPGGASVTGPSSATASATAPARPAPLAPQGADARPVTVLFSPPESSLRTGQSAGMALVLVGARDVQSVEASLVFDPTLLEVTDVAAGSLLTLDGSPVTAERTIESGRARVRFGRVSGASGSGAVVAVTLRGLKAGTGSVAVESLAIVRADGTERPAPPAPARVTVAP